MTQKSIILRKFLFLVEFESSALLIKINLAKTNSVLWMSSRQFPLQLLMTYLHVIKHIIHTFNGDAEKFYPEFYKVLSDAETPFTGLSRHSTFLVGFELANHVLALSIILAGSSKMIRC